MEVREGYKQTEVGVIPEDWVVNQLVLLSNEIGDGIHATPQYIDSSNYYFVNGNNLLNGNILITKDTKCVSIKEYDLLKKKLNNKTILMSINGTIGNLAVFNNETIVLGKSAAYINLREKIEKNFIYYMLQHSVVKDFYENELTGTTIRNLSLRSIRETPIPLPPTKAEQTAIAGALSDADALIQSLGKLIAKKRSIKQGAMQELLKPKEGWVVKKLREIADSTVRWSFTGGPFGSNLKSSDYTDDGVRIIQLQNIGDGAFINDYEVYTSEIKADELISCNIYPRDIILSKMGDPVARACIIPDFHKRYLMCSDGIRLAVDKKNYNTYFIYIYINSPQFRILAENASTGSTRKRIGLKELRNLEFWCPNLSEQTRIAAILSDMDAEIAALETKLAKNKQIKQGMMQELLTGRIRLV